MTYKGIKLRIYPNKEQQSSIKLNFGCNRFVWNEMLNMLIERYKNNPEATFPSAYTLNILLKPLKNEYPWLRESDSRGLKQTNNDLVEAYKKFFREHKGFPKFKSRKYPKQSYQSTIANNNIRLVDNHHIKLPKLGTIRFKGNKHITGKIKNVTVRLSTTNKYYATLTVDTTITELPKTDKHVGIDMGIADLMITSDSIKYPTIRFDKLLAKKKHYWEKRLARRRLQAKKEIAWDKHNKVLVPRELKDFSNYNKAKIMVAKYSGKIANQRNDYLHKLTRALVEQYDVIKIEDLKTKNLLKNHKLARAIANQSWREIRRQLEYKCEWYGKQLIIVNPRKTSQICSNCGYDDGKHELSVRRWVCPKCGMNHDRDINAARNILASV